MKTLLGIFAMAAVAAAQVRTVGAGTSVVVRTNEAIDAKTSDGRVFSGVVDQDVMGTNNTVVIPRGSSAELVVRQASSRVLTLDLESITANGQRYVVSAEESQLAGEKKDGVGTNKRSAKYIGGGAALGAIVGAIAGGGKGAAIGAAAGAGAGAGAQILTRGKSVKVPAESLLTFRLEQPLTVAGAGYTRSRQSRRIR